MFSRLFSMLLENIIKRVAVLFAGHPVLNLDAVDVTEVLHVVRHHRQTSSLGRATDDHFFNLRVVHANAKREIVGHGGQR